MHYSVLEATIGLVQIPLDKTWAFNGMVSCDYLSAPVSWIVAVDNLRRALCICLVK